MARQCIPHVGDTPHAAEPERTAWHDAAQRNGCPRERCMAFHPGDCHAVIRVHGRCLAAGVAEREARRVASLMAGAE